MMPEGADERYWRPTHAEPKTEEEIEKFKARWGEDAEGFEARWSLNRFPNPNIARTLSPEEKAQRDRERVILSLGTPVTKVKKTRKKKGVAEELDFGTKA